MKISRTEVKNFAPFSILKIFNFIKKIYINQVTEI